MNEPNEPGAESPGAEPFVLPEIRVGPDAPPAEEPPAEEPPAEEPPTEEPTTEEPPTEEPPDEEPPIVRHDPFAYMRGARWMDRKLSPSGRAAILLRRDLEAFPVIEGRDPNHADLDAIVQRTVDYIVPIIRREQATDFAYEELEKRRAARIASQTVQRDTTFRLPTATPDKGGVLPEAQLAGTGNCVQIIENCQRRCVALFEIGRDALPGSGSDSTGRMRLCVRNCVAPSGCSY
jgi:hypothetical protein